MPDILSFPPGRNEPVECPHCGGVFVTAAARSEHAATLAERSRILALIRAKAEEWRDEAKEWRSVGQNELAQLAGSQALTALELATLIEEGTPDA